MQITKEIKRNKQTKDFDLYLNGEYVGSRETSQEACAELDRLALQALAH